MLGSANLLTFCASLNSRPYCWASLQLVDPLAIETRLSDPALDGEAVAAAAGVSVRYANSVLAEEGTSIARYIQKRRLERCRRALEDPQQAHRSLSEIAYGWGFSEMTHFGRSFRKAYGMLPSVYRKLARPPSP